MKIPRVNDFDPEAKIPQLKSSLESMPAIQKPQPKPSGNLPSSPEKDIPVQHSSLINLPTARRNDEATARPTDRPTGKRTLVRRGFEWYEDQLEALKRISLKEQMEGRECSMSAMVREAVDDYLKKRSAGK